MDQGPIAVTTPRPHRIELTHEDLRALVVAVDRAVYPETGGASALPVEALKRLSVLHERLWEELRSDRD